jgi:glycosyltransferase involved in cell wall biosynthesis
LRLAVVSPFVDRRHGTERALSELLTRLARNYRCEIHLYSERVEGLTLDDPAGPPRGGNTGAIFWHRVPSLPGPHLLKFTGWMFLNGVVRWNHRFFRRLSFDLVLSPGINCRRADVILVHALFQRLSELSALDREEETPHLGFWRDLHRRLYYQLLTALERRSYSNRNVSLVAVSQRTADLLKQCFLREDTLVVPNGVDTAEFSVSQRLARRDEARKRRNFKPSDFVLLLIGNDWRVKGLPAILAAMAEMPSSKFHLLVAGVDAVAPFRDIAERMNVLGRCHWEPPAADIMDLYAAADVYVSPTLEDSFGLPVAEAMACGLPVITSAFAGVAAQIQNEVDGFVLRDPRDTQSLARLLERLAGDPEFSRRIGEAATRKTQDWTWDRNAAAVYELLNRIVARQPGATTNRLRDK